MGAVEAKRLDMHSFNPRAPRGRDKNIVLKKA